MAKKLCVFCTNLVFDYSYSENCPTCGPESEHKMKCSKGIWSTEIDDWSGSLKTYRQKILLAEGCAEYVPADDG